MADMMVRNKKQVLDALQLRITRMKNVEDELYREIVGKVFRRILNQTPLFSAHALGQWSIGIGAPTGFNDPDFGRSDLRLARSQAGEVTPLARGNRYWVNKVWQREKGKLAQIKKGKAVYITNSASGDTDNGKSVANYLEALQDPTYAASKLRPVNQPYEIVADSVAYVVAQYRGRKLDLMRYRFEESSEAI